MVHDPYSMCAGKTAYDSASAAAKARTKLGKRRNAKNHRNLDVYRCRMCSRWHLGTPPKTCIKDLKKMRQRSERSSRARGTDVIF